MICSEHLENLQFVNVWFIFAFTTLQSTGRRRLQTTGLSRFSQTGWFWFWGYLGCIHNTLQKPDLWEGHGTESHSDEAARRSIIYFLWRWRKLRCQMQSRIPARLQRLEEGSVCVKQQLSLFRVSVSHTNSTWRHRHGFGLLMTSNKQEVQGWRWMKCKSRGSWFNSPLISFKFGMISSGPAVYYCNWLDKLNSLNCGTENTSTIK